VQRSGAAAPILQPIKSGSRFNPRLTLAMVGIFTTLLMACWIRYFLRYPSSPFHASTQKHSQFPQSSISVTRASRDLKTSLLTSSKWIADKLVPTRDSSVPPVVTIPKPSPIIDFASAKESSAASGQHHEAMQIARKVRSTKVTPPPRLISMHHSAGVHKAVLRILPKGKTSHENVRKLHMTIGNHRPVRHPAALKSTSPSFISQARGIKTSHSPQKHAPEPTSQTADVRGSPNTMDPIGTNESGFSRSDSTDKSKPELDSSLADTSPPTNVSTDYNEAWRRSTPQHRGSAPDESWRKRRR
jgi:hypothetical protein